MKLKTFAAIAIAALVLGNAAPSHAQAASGAEPSRVAPSPEGVGDTRDTYGASDTSYVLGAYAFESFNSVSTFSGEGVTGGRFFTSVGGIFVAPAYLPNGAVITRMEIDGCDTNAGSNLAANLYSNGMIFGTEVTINHGVAVSNGASGCDVFSSTVNPAVTVTNQTRTYYIRVTTGATDNTVRLNAIRLFYHLQVSPAPATATFPNDVPTTHPFFRFVEAMAASGLTGGCGAGAFCPNDPVTRGQMSVFLAVALGLHFPN